MGKLDFLKKAAGAAKNKGGDAFDLLKQKWSGKAVPPKKDLLEGMVDTSGFFKKAAEDVGKAEYGRGGKKLSIFDKMKAGLGKTKTKYSELDKARSEAARMKNYFTVKKCPKCGQMHTGAEPCPVTGKPETGTVSEGQPAIAGTPLTEQKEKKIQFNTESIGKKIGGIIASGIMMVAAYGGAFIYRPEFAPLVLIIGGILVVFIIMSMFVKNAGGWLALGVLAVAGLALYYTHTVDPFIPQIIAYAEPITNVIDTGKEMINNGYNYFQCAFGMTAGIDLNKCMESKKGNQTESVNKLGPYETVELNWGRRLDDSYDYDLPESGQPYTLDVSFINKNSKVYKINFTEIYVWTSFGDPAVTYLTTPKSPFTGGKYTLEPGEELPIRFREFDFPTDWKCSGSLTFKINATTEQNSGGWSDFGIAPSDEDTYTKFIHSFNPNINAEPGPLNIYVYTDPWGISARDFKESIDDKDRAEVIIKIQNKVKTGTAIIKNFYLVQQFEVPQKLFEIDPNSCKITSGIQEIIDQTQYPNCQCMVGPYGTLCGSDCPVPALTPCSNPDNTPNVTKCLTPTQAPLIYTVTAYPYYTGEECPSNSNCLFFTFNRAYKLKPDKKITISCKIKNMTEPSDKYTDQIRVYAGFTYTQEWSKPIPCAT
jgi:hypothetical protein